MCLCIYVCVAEGVSGCTVRIGVDVSGSVSSVCNDVVLFCNFSNVLLVLVLNALKSLCDIGTLVFLMAACMKFNI